MAPPFFILFEMQTIHTPIVWHEMGRFCVINLNARLRLVALWPCKVMMEKSRYPCRKAA